MISNLSQSLIVRAGIVMAGVTLLALTSMLASVFIAETARGDAAAINLAGTLRMQSYRLAATLDQPDAETELLRSRIEQFERDLHSRTLTGLIPDQQSDALTQAYRGVHAQWQQLMRPALLGGSAEQAAYLRNVAGFVDRIDHMVDLLQRQAEQKIQLLRLIQGVALFLTLTLVFFAMYKLLTDVMPPLRELLTAVDRARERDFSPRISYRGADELGLLSRTFNDMADNLGTMYAELEQRVAQKTAALRDSNRALQLLYDTARSLNGEQAQPGDYRVILERIEQDLELGPITLCLANPESQRAFQRIATESGLRPRQCDAPDCSQCLTGNLIARAHAVDRETLSVPVAESGRSYGALLVRNPSADPVPPEKIRILETIGGHIAAGIALVRHGEQQRRLALMHERAVIARELHDSLAQSLSYLKIQVSRLQAELGKREEEDTLNQVTAELREGLTSAYRQLRELLNTFRLQMNEAGLHEALQTTVVEFRDRGGIDIRLDYGLAHCPLSPNEEVHVLQVIREALANVLHHAQARSAEVSLHVTAENRVAVTIRDDGIGIPEAWQQTSHYGVTIMRERAQELSGTLDIRRGPSGGTRVRMEFPPRAQRGAPGETQVMARR